jgi:DNA-binding transcriptional LysR family regulator
MESITVELRQLENFVAIAEESSFTRAARRVHLAQSTLSASIQALEHELGTRLFERSTRQVRLTDAGQALLTEARTALQAIDAGREAVAAVQDGLRGTVHLGIMQALTLFDLAAVLTRYHAEFPLVQIVPHTMRGGSAELVARVLDGTLDLAFASNPGPYPDGLEVQPLASEPILLAIPDGHPLADRDRIPLAELSTTKFVDYPAGWGTRLAVERAFEQLGLHREPGFEVADVTTSIELVRAGLGCAFTSRTLSMVGRPVTLRPLDPQPMWEVSLITSTHHRLSAATRRLVSLVLESVSE